MNTPAFTLKVYHDTEYYWSDDRSEYGGTDVFQRHAFRHLAPDGFMLSIGSDGGESLFRLAVLHSWKVKVTKVPVAEGFLSQCT